MAQLVDLPVGWTADELESILAGAWDFFIFQNVQTGCGAHKTSYSAGPGGNFPGDEKK
jgi:hypothetical protein